MLNTLYLIGIGVSRTILVKLVHFLHCFYACLLSIYGRCVVCRSALSFPTARSIFKLPAVYVLKNLCPCLWGIAYYAVSISVVVIILAVLMIDVV